MSQRSRQTRPAVDVGTSVLLGLDLDDRRLRFFRERLTRRSGPSPTSLSFLRENQPIQRIVRSLGGHLDMEDLVGVIPMGAFVAAPTNAD
jgi:hypothetical protein